MQLIVELPELNLQPGRLHLARRPMVIQTILGSCVGVTFWNAQVGAGALCHGVLPRCPRRWSPAAGILDGHRYVDFSIRYLAQKFDALGANRKEVQVKLFGGADVLPTSGARPGKLTVGAQNCEAALEVLEEEGFAVLAYDLGGTQGRRIHFHTGSGEVRVYKLGSGIGSA